LKQQKLEADMQELAELRKEKERWK